MSTFATQYTKFMVCPWCGAANEDSWEFDDTEYGTTECGNCEKEFDYIVHYDVRYSTVKRTERNQQ